MSQTQPPISLTRRHLLKSAGLTAAAAAAASVVPALSAVAADEQLIRPASPPAPHPDWFKGLKVGVASYTFRQIPVDATIKAINRLALSYVSIKDSHLPMKSTTEQRKEVAKKFRDSGINPISCGVISLTNDEEKCRNAFEYTRDIGAPTMVCSPSPESLSLLDKLVKEFDIRLAIHNHGPEDKTGFHSPFDVYKAVADHDKRIGLCIDVGHTARAGVDPSEAIRKCHDRLYDVHFKDIGPKPEGNKPWTNSAREVGRGILDIHGMLRALLDVKFAGHVGYEYEKDAADPLPGMAESVGFTKGVLSRMDG